ncbi:MAG: RNA polymerase sigma factor [Gemmatimonadaceae bacterium]
MARRPSEDDIRGIYRDTVDELFSFVSRRCSGDRELAEDITQETWLRAVRAWRADGIPQRPLAWLCTVAARLLSNYRRRPVADRFEDGTGDVLPTPDASTDRVVRRESVLRVALSRLPALQIRLLRAFHFERRPIAEIAASLGISERGVEGRLRRARQNLRREIESDPGAQGEIT